MLGALPLAAAPGPLPLLAERPARAAGGEPVLRGGRGSYSLSMVVPVSQAQAWRVLTSYEAMAGQMPDIQEARVLRRSGSRLELAQTYQAPYTFGLRIRARLAVVESPPGQMRYSLISGERIRRLQGSWTLVPVAGGVLVTHRIQLEPDLPAVLQPAYAELSEANLRQSMQVLRRLMLRG